MARYKKRTFQVGNLYLSQREGSPAWYGTTYDAETKRTRRFSLGTDDYDEACKALAQWYLENREVKDEEPDEAYLADVLRRWYKEHGQKLRSADHAHTSVNYWLDFWQTSTVADVRDVKRQEKFHAFLLGKGMKNSSANRVLAIGKAAMNRAFRRGELTAAPHVLMLKKQEALPKGEAMTVEELRKLYAASPIHLQSFIRWMLGTAARPEAIRTLHSDQVNWERGTIKLNPDGREQNKKRRPNILLPPSLKADRFSGFLVQYDGDVVGSVRTAWRLSVKRAGLNGRFHQNSLRHTAIQWMARHGVPLEHIQEQVGHREPDKAVTFMYLGQEPLNLKKACAALDKLVREVTGVPKTPVTRQRKDDREANAKIRQKNQDVSGAAYVTRTRDPIITNDVLYRLS